MRARQRELILAGGIALAVVGAGSHAGGPEDNPELKGIFERDQADRLSPGPRDLLAVARRDEQRLARVKELYAAGVPRTGADWFHAALVLQHAQDANDILLAHEMALASLATGEPRAKWLAAATEDRFLRRIGRPQRFGTQYESRGGPPKLAETAPGVTNQLREALLVPALPEPGSELRQR